MKRYRPYKFEENALPREILKQYTKVQNIYKDLYKKIGNS